MIEQPPLQSECKNPCCGSQAECFRKWRWDLCQVENDHKVGNNVEAS